MTSSRATTDLNGHHHGLRRQTIVQSLLADVFHARLRPGQHLVTRQLAERFGVSHTPIREALISLAGIGVIDLLPNRGAVVRRVTGKEIREIYEVRRVLECEAARLACGRIDPTLLAALAAQLRQLHTVRARSRVQFIARARDVDNRLHDLIAAACGNAFLSGELNRLKMLFRAFRDLAWEHDRARHDAQRLAEEAEEHLAIVNALAANNRGEAGRAMSRHIRSGGRYWSRALPQSGGNGQAPPAQTARPARKDRPR